ncbi:glutaredoxin domain-containing protein [Candidatus Neomarinimicrobiota bacterium]
MIEIYTTFTCLYCGAAKRLLSARGYNYSEINIETIGLDRNDLQKKTGGRTVPQIVIDGKSIGGYEELAYLDSTGDLKKLVSIR